MSHRRCAGEAARRRRTSAPSAGSGSNTTTSSSATPCSGRAATPPWCASTTARRALAMTTDVTPRYCEADPFEGGKQAVAEAWRNLTAVGARAARGHRQSQFRQSRNGPRSWASSSAASSGIGEACRALDFPVVSGNVSLYNETKGRGDPADADHRRRRPARRFHQVGDARLQGRRRGDPADRRDARAGSASRSICATSAAARRARRRRSISRRSARNGDFVRALIARRHASRAVHDVSDGGLLVALAEMAMASGIGAELDARAGARRRMPSGSARIRRAMW